MDTRPRLAPTEPSPWMRHLPPVVVAEVQRRRDLVLASAVGRLLDLDEPGALARVLARGQADPTAERAEHERAEHERAEHELTEHELTEHELTEHELTEHELTEHELTDAYETIVSTCRLIDVADLPAAVAGMHRLLAPGGTIHLVEPVNRPGVSGLLSSSVGALLPAVAGLHLGRDVVRTVRADGLTVNDLDRFVVPTRVWPLRRFVELSAIVVERPAPAPNPDPTVAVGPESQPDAEAAVTEGASS